MIKLSDEQQEKIVKAIEEELFDHHFEVTVDNVKKVLDRFIDTVYAPFCRIVQGERVNNEEERPKLGLSIRKTKGGEIHE